jgi:hypothetical protein
MKTLKREPEILIDSAHGIYIPQYFAEAYGTPDNFYNWGEIKEDIDILLSGPDNEFYWDAYEDLINNAKLKTTDNKESYLYTHEDLWAVPVDYDNEDFFE